MDLMIEVVRLLDLCIALEVWEMMVPLRATLTLHIAHRIWAIDCGDAHSTCFQRVNEDHSIGGRTHDVAWEHTDPGFFSG